MGKKQEAKTHRERIRAAVNITTLTVMDADKELRESAARFLIREFNEAIEDRLPAYYPPPTPFPDEERIPKKKTSSMWERAKENEPLKQEMPS